MAGIDPPIGMPIGSASTPNSLVANEICLLRETLEKILEHMIETQEANMRMLNNVLKEAHEDD